MYLRKSEHRAGLFLRSVLFSGFFETDLLCKQNVGSNSIA